MIHVHILHILLEVYTAFIIAITNVDNAHLLARQLIDSEGKTIS